jgi:hypothetical protein
LGFEDAWVLADELPGFVLWRGLVFGVGEADDAGGF